MRRHFAARFSRWTTRTLAFLLTASAALAQQEGDRAVSALGRIEPQGGIVRLGAPSIPEAVSGSVLARLLVEEGERVSAGQLLAVTDAAAVVEARLSQAKADEELAVQAAKAARSKADEACVLADVAREEAARRASLLERNLASREETEQAEGEAAARRASCVAAQANARVADSAIRVARAALGVREAELARTRVVAPTDGTVLEIIVQPGELIGAEGVIEFGDTGRMVAVAEVYETDIRRVRLGQRARITSDALDRALEGTVNHVALKVHKHDEIGTDPAARKDARIIEVDVLLDEPEKVAALSNLQVEVVIYP